MFNIDVFQEDKRRGNVQWCTSGMSLCNQAGFGHRRRCAGETSGVDKSASVVGAWLSTVALDPCLPVFAS